MEQSSLVGKSLSPPWTILSIGFFLKDWIRSHSFGSSRTNTISSSTIFKGLCYAVLCCCGLDRRWCCVVVAQIGGGFLLL